LARLERHLDRAAALTGGAIVGLLALNAWLLVVGTCVLFAARGWTSWRELFRLSGLAYMLGVAVLGVVWVWQLVVGVPLSLAAIFVSGLVVAAAALTVGLRLGRRLPSPSRLAAPSLSLVGALFAGLTLVYFEALFRAGRLAGLYEFDAWSFWVPKAKAIYYFGGLDEQFFRELPGESYPPLVPALEAAAFHFMGAADVVTVHLQFWFLLFGFVFAVVGVLAQRVPPLFLWPPLLLVLVTPHVVGHALQPQADFLLDEFFALGALMVALWLLDGERWQIGLAAVFGAAAMLTKREGYVLVACLFVASLAASGRVRGRWRSVAAVAVIAAAAAAPWRAFLAVRDLSGGAPEAGGTGLLSNADRAWPSLRLTLSTLFDFEIWLVVMPVLIVALVGAFAVRDRRLPTFVAVLGTLCIAAFTWSTWAFPSLAITKEAALNPIVRFSGALIVSAAVLTPLLLTRAREGVTT
jgi:hypothetical protein